MQGGELCARLVAIVDQTQRETGRPAGGVEHGLGARVGEPLDHRVGGEQAGERGVGIGTQCAIGGEQRLGAVDPGRQHHDREACPLGESQRGHGQLVCAVQHDGRERRVARAPQREIEPVAGRLGRGAPRQHGDRRGRQGGEPGRLLDQRDARDRPGQRAGGVPPAEVLERADSIGDGRHRHQLCPRDRNRARSLVRAQDRHALDP